MKARLRVPNFAYGPMVPRPRKRATEPFIRILFAAILILVFPRVCPAQSPESIFLVWLMNNESRAMSILEFDRKVMDRMASPFGFLPALVATGPAHAEEKLWDLHTRFYRVVPEIGKIYVTATRFGSGKLAASLAKAFPGTVLVAPIIGLPACRAQVTGPILDERFRRDILSVLGIGKDRDADLSGRFQKVLGSMTDTDRRFLAEYVGTFLALFPGNQQTRLLDSILKKGIAKEASQGVTDVIRVAVGREPAPASGVSDPVDVSDSDFLLPPASENTVSLPETAATPASPAASLPPAGEGSAAGVQIVATGPATLEPPDSTQIEMFNIMQ